MRATFISSNYKLTATSNTPSKVTTRNRLSYSSQLQKFIRSLNWFFQKRKSTVFITLKHLLSPQLSYSDTKKIQQLFLSLQKKTFTSKLWVFYKLKNFKDDYSGNSTLFSHISSPRVRTVSSERDNQNPTKFIENKVSAIYKLALVLNKPIQMNVLKSFWMIFLYRKPVKVVNKVDKYEKNIVNNVNDELFECDSSDYLKNEKLDYGIKSGKKDYYYDKKERNDYKKVEKNDSCERIDKTGFCSKNDTKNNLSLFRGNKGNGNYCKGQGNGAFWEIRKIVNEKFWIKSINEISQILGFVERRHKNWAFEGLKKGNMRNSSGFFRYLVSKESVYGMRALSKIFAQNRKRCLGYAVGCISSLKKRIISSKNIRKFESTICKIIEKKVFKSIYSYGFIKRVMQKVNLLTYYLIKITKKSQAFGFFKIKSYIKYKNFALKQFTEALQRVFLFNKAITFLQIRRFSNELMPHKSNSRVIQRVESKLTTLPTIFLQGDPSYNKYEEFSFSTTNKRQTLFKF